MNVRKATIEDAKQIAEIYNFYIQSTYHTFETEPVSSVEMQKSIGKIIKNYPFLVCEENKEIFGYAYATQYKSRCAYKNSAEVSVYIKNYLKQKGIGTKLYEKLFEELSKT
ncbi:MAG: N-acetyltransferase family protein, partial [Acidobacteria bacterium]|nr:N-acetyltransferase family protein [Acidobacteriota bacterium]